MYGGTGERERAGITPPGPTGGAAPDLRRPGQCRPAAVSGSVGQQVGGLDGMSGTATGRSTIRDSSWRATIAKGNLSKDPEAELVENCCFELLLATADRNATTEEEAQRNYLHLRSYFTEHTVVADTAMTELLRLYRAKDPHRADRGQAPSAARQSHPSVRRVAHHPRRPPTLSPRPLHLRRAQGRLQQTCLPPSTS